MNGGKFRNISTEYEALMAAEQIVWRVHRFSTNDGGKFRNISTESVLKEIRAALAKAGGRA